MSKTDRDVDKRVADALGIKPKPNLTPQQESEMYTKRRLLFISALLEVQRFYEAKADELEKQCEHLGENFRVMVEASFKEDPFNSACELLGICTGSTLRFPAHESYEDFNWSDEFLGDIWFEISNQDPNKVKKFLLAASKEMKFVFGDVVKFANKTYNGEAKS